MSKMQGLIEAIVNDDIKSMVIRIEKGANINGYEDAAKITPLHYAAQYNAYQCAKYLLNAGANPNAETNDSQTPVNIASLHGSHEVSMLLLDALSSD